MFLQLCASLEICFGTKTATATDNKESNPKQARAVLFFAGSCLLKGVSSSKSGSISATVFQDGEDDGRGAAENTDRDGGGEGAGDETNQDAKGQDEARPGETLRASWFSTNM